MYNLNIEKNKNIKIICDKIPHSFLRIKSFNGRQIDGRPLLCLFDSGSTLSFMAKAAIPESVVPNVGRPLQGNTMAGTFQSTGYVVAEQLSVPELNPSRTIVSLDLRVMEVECRCDIVLG